MEIMKFLSLSSHLFKSMVVSNTVENKKSVVVLCGSSCKYTYYLLSLISCFRVIMAFLLFFGVLGCSSNSTKKKAEKEKEYSAIENVVARTSSEKYNLVKCKGKCGIYDVDEVEILPLRYDEILCTIEDGNNDFFIVELDGKKGVLLSHETPFVSIEFDNIYYDDGVYQGFFEVELNGKVGLFDKNGNNVVPCRYDNVQLNRIGYPYGIFIVRQGDKYGCVINGKEMIPCNYYSIIITDDYIMTSLHGESSQVAMNISNKYQVYENGYMR